MRPTPQPAPGQRQAGSSYDDQALQHRESGENFPVALRLLPRRHRDHLHAVYAYARTVDELGDSYAGDRTAALKELAADVDVLFGGGEPGQPVLRQLAPTVRARGLSKEPFVALIEANLQDQTVSRYATFAQLRDYCGLSADPVGRIVLEVFGQATPGTIARSDEVCTALQLLEHWQDVAEDRKAGRVYVPQEDLVEYGVDERELDASVAGPRLRELMRFEIERAAQLLAAGSSLVGLLRGWCRVAVAGYIAGGQATVVALRQTDGDVLSATARPSRPGTAARALGLLGPGLLRSRVVR